MYFLKILQSKFHENLSSGAELFHADGETTDGQVWRSE